MGEGNCPSAGLRPDFLICSSVALRRGRAAPAPGRPRLSLAASVVAAPKQVPERQKLHSQAERDMGPVEQWPVPLCPFGATSAASRRCKSGLGARFADAVGHCNTTDSSGQSVTGSESGSPECKCLRKPGEVWGGGQASAGRRHLPLMARLPPRAWLRAPGSLALARRRWLFVLYTR